jgi:hypothetical protein
MSGLDKKNSRDSSRTSETASFVMATPMMSNMESHYPRMGMLMPLPLPGTSGIPYFTGKNEKVWCQEKSGVSFFLVPAFLWRQYFPGARKGLAPDSLWGLIGWSQ